MANARPSVRHNRMVCGEGDRRKRRLARTADVRPAPVCFAAILANFWKVEVGTLEMRCDLDHSDREAIIARAKPSLF